MGVGHDPFHFPYPLFLPIYSLSSYSYNINSIYYLRLGRQPVAGVILHITLYKVSLAECARLRQNVPYVKVHRYNPKHLYPKSNGYGDNGERSLKV